MPIKLEFKNFISREYVKKNPDKTFIFGDNLERGGYGGQAKEMRGEPNAIGIPTKKLPSMTDDSFFTDDEFSENKKAINIALSKIPRNATVVMSSNGIGSGRAELMKRAPKTWEYLTEEFKALQKW